MKQTTTTTTVEVGTVKNSTGSVPVKGLNIALGTGIKCAADGTTGRAVWNGPVVTVDMKNSQGGTVYQLKISLDQDGETYEFTSVTTAVIISNLTIEYEKVEIPAFSYSGRQKGAWLPPYLIANCLYLTSAKSMASSGTLYKITVDDTGTLKATEVTS